MKKVKVCVSLCISREVEVEVEDEYNEDDLYYAFTEQESLPMGVYDYDTNNSDDWIVDDLTVVEVK